MEYRPNVPPRDPSELPGFLEEELRKIANAFTEQDRIYMRVLHEEPIRPREGQLVWADGTDWDPGAGAGPYAYIGGVWVELMT